MPKNFRHCEEALADEAIQGAFLKQRSPPEGAAAKFNDLTLDRHATLAMTRRCLHSVALRST